MAVPTGFEPAERNWSCAHLPASASQAEVSIGVFLLQASRPLNAATTSIMPPEEEQRRFVIPKVPQMDGSSS